MSKGWDNATLKKLKALTGKGLSTSEIGKRLGMSKNAIVGKLNRLGWNAKAGGAAAAAVSGVEKKTVEVKKTAIKNTNVKKMAGAKKETAAKKSESKESTKKTSVIKSAPQKAEDKISAKASAKNLAMHQRIIQHSLEMANLKPNQCRWPIGDPDSELFHFCGETVFVGKPYCYEHCKQAYQFAPPKKK